MSTETNAPAGAEAPTPASTGLSILDSLGDEDVGRVPSSAEDEDPEEPAEPEGEEPEDDDAPSEDDEEETPAEDDDEAEPEQPKPAKEKIADKDALVTLRDGSKPTVLDLIKKAELVPELQKQLAQRPQELEAAAREVTTQRQQLQTLLPLAVQALARNMPPEPNPALINDDPIQYIQDKHRYDTALAELRGLKQAQDAQQHQVVQAQSAQFQDYVRTERGRLLDAIPELKDPARATEFAKDFTGLATQLGFTPEEATKVYDHRLFKLAQLAMKGLEAEKTKAVVKEKVAQKVREKPPVTATVTAPAARTSPAERERSGARSSLERLRKTGSVQDAEAFLSRFS